MYLLWQTHAHDQKLPEYGRWPIKSAPYVLWLLRVDQAHHKRVPQDVGRKRRESVVS
jgi:hypothetical protein